MGKPSKLCPLAERVGKPEKQRKELPYRRATGAAATSISVSSSEKAMEEGDNDDDANDDEEGENDDSFSMSIKSQVDIQPVYENGRRYCNITYFMPNDQVEQTRLNINHQAFLLLLDGGLTKAPLPSSGPKRVLDVGTGPGDWAVEMAQMYPSTEVIATDIGVFDECPAILGLPNVHFRIDDAEEEWEYHEPFEFIHFRGLSGAFRDWQAVYKQAFKHLSPGGYIEIVETDPSLESFSFRDSSSSSLSPSLNSKNNNTHYRAFVSAMHDAAELLGFSPSRDHMEPSHLRALGFVDVVVHNITVPVGPWPSDPRQSTLGKMVLIAFLEGLEARSLRRLTATGKWTVEEVRDLCEKVKLEAIACKGSTVAVRFVTARKPALL